MLSLFQKKIRTDYFRLSASVSHPQKSGTAYRIRHLHFTDCTVLWILEPKLLYERIPQSNRNNSETVSVKKEMNHGSGEFTVFTIFIRESCSVEDSANFLIRSINESELESHLNLSMFHRMILARIASKSFTKCTGKTAWIAESHHFCNLCHRILSTLHQ